jgi:hypothetical protein
VHGRDHVSVFAARHVADAARSGAALPLWRAAESLALQPLVRAPARAGCTTTIQFHQLALIEAVLGAPLPSGWTTSTSTSRRWPGVSE